MKISQNIEQAEKNYPGMYHVISSNEVHSYERFITAHQDYCDAIIEEEKLKTNFIPQLIKIADTKPPLPIMYTYYDSEAGMQNEVFFQLNLIVEHIELFRHNGDSTGTIYQDKIEILSYENTNNNIIWKPINQ